MNEGNMKCFTKEWYELCQKTHAHLSLEESKEAERFSEEFFHVLYCEKLNEFLAGEQKMSSASFDDLYPAELDKEFLEGMTEDEIEEIQTAYYSEREEAMRDDFEPEPYDPEKLTQQFQDAQVYNIEHAKEVLPAEILNAIADIRVFVLDKASKQIIRKVKAFCVKNEKAMEKTFRDYQKYEKSMIGKINEEILEGMRFHDCKVESVSMQDDTVEIRLDNSGGFTDINRVRFEGCRIIKQDGLLENAWWLYEEVYQAINGYEIHVLLTNEQEELIEFIIYAQHICFFRDES